MASTGDRTTPRVMFYSHDTYGLGHLRRTLAVADYLQARHSSLSQLILTGSPVAQKFNYPDRTDYIKLPSVVKVGAGAYESRSLHLKIGQILDLRRDIMLSAARHVPPDTLVVDHAPAGLKGELVDTLRYLKAASPDTRLLLGLRDIIDEAPRVRQAWAGEGVYELLDSLYDRILVYGQPDVFDVVQEYGLSPRAAEKTHYVGYLRRARGFRSPQQIRAELPLRTSRLVLVTGGGGGDAYDLLRVTLDAIRLWPEDRDQDWLLVGGPLMSPVERALLLERIPRWAAVHWMDFTPNLVSFISAADAVVSMGGYNAVCEILSLGRPALIVPRVSPRREQLIRAEALARRGLVRMLHPADLSPGRLREEVDSLLQDPPRAEAPLDFGGLPTVAAEIEASLMPEWAGAAERFSRPAVESGVA